TVVDARHIVTAAHCVLNSDNPVADVEALYVPRFKKGRKIRVTDSLEIASAQWKQIEVADVIVHPEYLAAARDMTSWRTCAQDSSCRAVYVRPPFPPDVAVIVAKDDIGIDPAAIFTGNLPDKLFVLGYGCEVGHRGLVQPWMFKQKYGVV